MSGGKVRLEKLQQTRKNLEITSDQRILEVKKLSDNLQTTFDFNRNENVNARLSPTRAYGARLPDGYKGFASFHKY